MPLVKLEYRQIDVSPLNALPHWQGVLFLGSWKWNPYLSPLVEPKTAAEMLECMLNKFFAM